MTAYGHEPEEGAWVRFRRWLASLFAPPDDDPVFGESRGKEFDLESIAPEDVEQFERARLAIEEKLRLDAERNFREPLRIRRLQLASVDFFADTAWELQPSMNVLLGRNGHGKSLLLRSLAGMLQRHDAVTKILVAGDDRGSPVEKPNRFLPPPPKARIELELTRDGEQESLSRDSLTWLAGSVGKVPLLAIPDSRFTDRRSTIVSDPGTVDLAFDGALHFLDQEPYQSVVQGLLWQLCLDYSDHGSFDLPTFKLLGEVVRRLTDETFRFHSIERFGRAGFQIWVLTEGLDRPLPIQQASQGTLSVLAMFGLIRSFLQDIAEVASPDGTYDVDEVQNQEAIVLIDEIDAHLHPMWQQKIRNLLTDSFPNVQFVLSAHSPLVVAGCGPGEVTVLRRSNEGFRVEPLDRDFVGVSAQDLYRDIFNIEDLDEIFLEYATKEARGEGNEIDERIAKLEVKEDKAKLSPADEQDLEHLLMEQRRIRRVAEVREDREGQEQRVVQRDAEIERLKDAIAVLEDRLGSALGDTGSTE
jgi:energy-coupling factor transporter ATP-binding protein EcfA2